MKVKVENIKDKANEVKLEFTVEAQKFEEAIQTVYKKSARYFKIPGFRNGKAPFKMVEKMYGIQIFYEDAFNEIAPKVYEEGIKENKKVVEGQFDMFNFKLAEIAHEIDKINLNELTPIDALNTLMKIKEKMK